MDITVRPMQEADFPACVTLLKGRLAYSETMIAELPRFWSRLLRVSRNPPRLSHQGGSSGAVGRDRPCVSPRGLGQGPKRLRVLFHGSGQADTAARPASISHRLHSRGSAAATGRPHRPGVHVHARTISVFARGKRAASSGVARAHGYGAGECSRHRAAHGQESLAGDLRSRCPPRVRPASQDSPRIRARRDPRTGEAAPAARVPAAASRGAEPVPRGAPARSAAPNSGADEVTLITPRLRSARRRRAESSSF